VYNIFEEDNAGVIGVKNKVEDCLEKLPDHPGVYIMKNDMGRIIYIGKAKSLKKRVRQYFQSSRSHSVKTQTMVSRIEDIEYLITNTELEALILECTLIKKHRPKYNVLLKDDKHYPYIRVTMEEVYPRIVIARDVKKNGSKYFGPYRNSYAVKQTIDAINRLFPIRTCNKILSGAPSGNRPCLNYYIERCLAPCQGNVSKEEYRKMMKKICLFLGHRHDQLIKVLEEEMKKSSDSLDFEKAARLRDQISAVRSISEKQRVITTSMEDQDVIAFARDKDKACVQVFFIRNGKLLGGEHYFLQDIEEMEIGQLMTEFVKRFYSGTAFVPGEILLQNNPDEAFIIEQWLKQKKGSNVRIKIPEKGDKKKIVEMTAENAAEILKNFSEKIKKVEEQAYQAMDELYQLLDLEEFPFRIEAFDVSNIQGMEPVGSMVVFEEGKPKKNDYRRYKIKWVNGPDDYESMREITRRRYKKYTDNSFEILPQLILVDGGKGQVSAVKEVLNEMDLNMPVCGMVKDDRHRTRGLIKDGKEIDFGDKKSAYRFVAAIQDEAHRFAITYHRSLRSRKQVRSVLGGIKGIGDKRRKSLLKHFGSIDAVKNATVEELAAVESMNIRAAQEVNNFFTKKLKGD